MGDMPGAIVHRPTAWSRKGKSPQTSDYQRKQMETAGGSMTAPGYFQFCFYHHFKNREPMRGTFNSWEQVREGQDDTELQDLTVTYLLAMTRNDPEGAKLCYQSTTDSTVFEGGNVRLHTHWWEGDAFPMGQPLLILQADCAARATSRGPGQHHRRAYLKSFLWRHSKWKEKFRV